MARRPWARLRAWARALGLLCALAAAGCSGTAASDDVVPADDAVAEPAALSASGACDQTKLITRACSSLAFGIEWNAPAGPRRTMIQRGMRWLDLGVAYSKTDTTDGYRQDGAGAVSMAWDLGASSSTAHFAPYGHACSYELGSLDELRPGDALNRTAPRGHIALFAKWGDDTHQSLVVLEQAGPGRLMQLRTMSRADARAYAPIRKNGL